MKNKVLEANKKVTGDFDEGLDFTTVFQFDVGPLSGDFANVNVTSC